MRALATRLVPASLQARLLLLVLGLVVTVWLAAAGLTWFDVRHELDELLDSHLAQAAALLVAQQAGEIEDEADRSIDAPSLHRYAPKVAFQVFHEGRLALRSLNAPAQPMVPLGRAVNSGFTTVQIDGVAWRMFSARGAENDIQVLVGEQIASRSAILRAVLRGTLWPLALALPLLALAAWVAIWRGVAPLRSLGQLLAARGARETAPLVMADVPAEMVQMLDALNHLFARIGAMVEAESRFTADAAHELRTPIAGIRAQAQVALSVIDEALRSRALHRTIEGCDRAAHLVDQLLVVSRLDAEAAPPMTPVDLSAVALHLAAELAPAALAKGQAIELDAPQPCSVPGNRALLEVLLRNLIDNAIRYGPQGARILISVHCGSGLAALSVEDSGPGLAEADCRRLGERFFRVPGHLESGSGLGWSIVRRIAQLHGAVVQLGRSQRLGGLAVRLGMGLNA